MQIDLLRDIIGTIAGKQAAVIADLLINSKNVNEFLIAKKLNLTINQTRTILYKLADEGLVSFLRKKDNKKGGWYTYFWTLNTGKSLVKFRDNLLREADGLSNHVELRKTKQFFYCKNCDIEYAQEAALLNDYTCNECGEVLEAKDSTQEISEFEAKRAKLLKAVEELELEIQSIDLASEKSRQRRIKADILKKKKERLKKKEERDKEKKKLAGKDIKTNVKSKKKESKPKKKLGKEKAKSSKKKK